MIKFKTIAFAILLSLTANAQYPIVVNFQDFTSSVPQNATMTVQTVQGTLPSISVSIPDTVLNIGSSLYFWFGDTTLNLASPSGVLLFSYIDCNATPRSWTRQYNTQIDTIQNQFTYCGNGVLDCYGIPSGSSGPNSACNDGNPSTINDVFDANCQCNGVAAAIDCNGVIGGNDLPGNPCDDMDPNTFYDCWDASCNCIGISSSPCDATFIPFQPLDSLGQPSFGQLLVVLLNPNTGSSTFSWDMGDGTTYNTPYFTHNYPGNGPYQLCLTLTDGLCTDTYCDTVQVDTSGLIIPLQPGAQGFGVTILSNTPNSISEFTQNTIPVYPSPTSTVLNVSLQPNDKVQIFDMNGRIALLPEGTSGNSIDVSRLEAGMYVLVVSRNGRLLHSKFLKD